ncbi:MULTISPECIES: flavodoxin domain-containing protein [Clostridium]|uniref:flavodoxin domain-containing protein n=1 Tax=Clostridium TaxID=1485 RepID=UPI000826B5D9|nr:MULTISPECIES: flavodoxin domain-containing protein [Clostridium]PJI09082.1 flavodoxin [Clostridium sp. CT7]
MKTVIIYSTKHEFTKDCSIKLSQKLNGDVELFNLKENNDVKLDQYDNVIIGSPIYMGQILKEIQKFCMENLDKLKDKNIGLFLCGMSEEKKMQEFFNAFPEALLNKSIVKECFGGAFIFKKMNFFEKFIVKRITKSSDDMMKNEEENIDKFAQKFNLIEK